MDPIPTSDQMTQIVRLTRELAEICGMTNVDVIAALLNTRTLRGLGYRGNGRIETEQQAQACIALLENWIRKRHGELEIG